ncbi:hypothetical protein R1flu_002327 [Riccia fluitans]|uniref:Uncharacterized protein n=1 Tax=Riccia fluitans TaxID=41844 RepID=A0ABD1Y5S6_9MARC
MQRMRFLKNIEVDQSSYLQTTDRASYSFNRIMQSCCCSEVDSVMHASMPRLHIAMAGTGIEQLVGLGKAVFTLPGSGPQFTYAFAEAQSRLLGKSLAEVLADQGSFRMFVYNGFERMGSRGSSRRIAIEILNVIR